MLVDCIEMQNHIVYIRIILKIRFTNEQADPPKTKGDLKEKIIYEIVENVYGNTNYREKSKIYVQYSLPIT